MTIRDLPNKGRIEEKLSWAEECYRSEGDRFLGDERIAGLLQEFRGAARLSREEMARAGVARECRECEEREGGSCCGTGLEEKYSATMILINLLLGKKIPGKRYDPQSCFFLGRNGCILLARHVICVNYLCGKVTDRIDPKRIAVLREKEGVELELLFLLHERIKKILDTLMINIKKETEKSLQKVASFYDQKKVGDVGPLGFRRSTDLSRMKAGLNVLIDRKVLVPKRSVFLDMGCADGRVNILFSYLVKKSIGIELDEWSLDEYLPLRRELETVLKMEDLSLPPDNISLFHGDSMDQRLHESISRQTGVGLKDIDLFYTYLTMQEEFAALIARWGRKGAIFMVYGLERIMPRFEGFRLLTPEGSIQGILALYQKT